MRMLGGGQRQPAASTYIVVVRHGERLDEADREAWRRHCKERPHERLDPPLTENGWRQAAAAGQEVRRALRCAGQEESVPLLLSSPTSRTISTAAAVGAELGVQEIVPDYSLNCCAAGLRYGVGHPLLSRTPAEAMLGPHCKVTCTPRGNPAKIDELNKQRHDDAFVLLVQDLAARQPAGSLLVLVTHREGIWQLKRHLGLPLTRASYCSVDFVRYQPDTRRLTSWEVQAGPAAGSPSSVPPPASNSETLTKQQVWLEELLSRGTGRVMVKRPTACEQGVHATTQLWKTPGVRGDWAGAVANGESVDLLSSPQPSEEEGDFVLVRLASGVEGWVKLKNICLPEVAAVVS